MIPIEPKLTTTPVLDLQFPELKEGTHAFEDEIHLQRWLLAEMNQRWRMRPRGNKLQASLQDVSINDFVAMVFRHYYDLGVNFTLQGKRLRGFNATYLETTQTVNLDPIIEQGPMTIEVTEIHND